MQFVIVGINFTVDIQLVDKTNLPFPNNMFFIISVTGAKVFNVLLYLLEIISNLVRCKKRKDGEGLPKLAVGPAHG